MTIDKMLEAMAIAGNEVETECTMSGKPIDFKKRSIAEAIAMLENWPKYPVGKNAYLGYDYDSVEDLLTQLKERMG